MILAGANFGDFGGPVEEMRTVAKQVLTNLKRAESSVNRRDCEATTRNLLAAQGGYAKIKMLRNAAGLPPSDVVTDAMLTRMARTSLTAKSRCK